jgi:hypothetical protein
MKAYVDDLISRMLHIHGCRLKFKSTFPPLVQEIHLLGKHSKKESPHANILCVWVGYTPMKSNPHLYQDVNCELEIIAKKGKKARSFSETACGPWLWSRVKWAGCVAAAACGNSY